MAETALKKLKAHYRQLKNDRHTWEPFWCDVRDYIAPQRGRGIFSPEKSEVNRGAWDTRKRVNGIASRALSILASGMQSGLTSKARQWFMLTHPDPELSRYQPVREWYDTVQEVLEGIFRRSNLYSSLLHTYYEMAGFGQGALAVLAHPTNTLFCRPYTTGTYYLSSDQWGAVDTFIQVEWLSARQLVAEYGLEKLPNYVVSAYENNRYEERFEVINAILKHPEVYGIKASDEKPVASVHFLEKSSDDSDFLRVAGYRTFPVMTPRWDAIDNDVYGWSPTRDVIDDVRMLQKMDADTLKAVAKTVSPPWRIPPELERRGLNTQPNALNVVSNMGESAVAPLFSTPVNIQQLQAKIDAIEQGIRDGLYNSLFLALLTQDNPQMTAREVAERHEEKLLMLGPVLERIHAELLDPLIDRAFVLAYEEGMIPPAPDELKGQPTQIEYVSILSQAQKAVGVSRIEQSMQFLGSLSSVFPELRHAVDPFKAYQEYNHMIGVKSAIFRSEDEYQKACQQEQQQMQVAQGAATGESVANAAKTLSEVDTANLQEILGGGTDMGGVPLG